MPETTGTSDDPIEAEILAAIEDAIGRGRRPNRNALVARFPRDADLVDRLLRATDRYHELKHALAGSGGGDLCAGTRLGDYEVVDLLGRGGMGVVYRARQLSLDGRLVALKVLPLARQDPDRVRRFRREALALADLHHPSLAQVHGFGEQDGILFFAMRLVDGVTLAEVLQRASARAEPWSDNELRRVVRAVTDVAAALSVVHAAGVVHRDVKPSNVILETADGGAARFPEARAVIVDFGLVRDLELPTTDTTTRTSGATPAYAPPEQLLGQPVDARADVFALGVTLHDLILRRLPGDRSQASIGLEPLTREHGVDRDLAAIVAKACDPESKWRYPDARALHADLVAWLAGATVSARRPPLLERGRRFLRHHPRAALRAVLLGVSIVLVAVAADRLRSWSEAAGQAERAAASGDLPLLMQALDRLPERAPALFVDEPAVAAFARVTRGIGPSDERGTVVERLRRLDPVAAVALAAERIEVFGFDDGTFEAFVLEAGLRASRDAAPAVLDAAVFGVARVFHVRPDWSTSDVRRGARLRVALRRVLAAERAGGSEERRQWIFMALSGCGTPDDLPALLEFVPRQFPATPTDAFPETCRLALAAIERIVRRFHPGSCGALAFDDWRRVRDGCGPAIEFALRNFGAHAAPFPNRCRSTAHHLFNALACCEAVRERDERAALAALLPAAWSAQPFADGTDDWSGRVMFAAPTHPSAVAADLLARRTDPRFSRTARKWPDLSGWLAGVCGDRDLLQALREPIGEAEGLEEFDEGVEAGHEELLGISRDLMPRPLYPEQAVTLRQERDDRPEPGAGSGWDFRAGNVVWSGAACAVTTDAVLVANEGKTFSKRLAAPGRSTLDLEFDSPPLAGIGLCRIEIHAKFGVRMYTPFGGVALLDVRLDDREVCSALAISDTTKGEFPLTLFEVAHVPGQRHHLVLKSNPRSLAQIWIERVTATLGPMK